jgi:hypothetical protein
VNIPITDPLNYVGIFFLLAGFFLILAGLSIIKVEKITVAPGKKTLGFGVVFSILGCIILVLINFLLTRPPVSIPTISPSAGVARLDLWVAEKSTCKTKINGFVEHAGEGPMTWKWGDQIVTEGGFPQEHEYLQSGTYTLVVITSSGFTKSLTFQIECKKALN